MNFSLKYYRILLLALPVFFWSIFYCLFDFDGLYGQDAYEYLRYSKAIYNFMISGVNPGDYFWPLFYPVIGAIINLVIQNSDLSLLLTSVFSLSISAFFLDKIIHLLFRTTFKFSTLFVLLFFLLSPYILKHDLLIMSDGLATCFIVLTVYHFIKFRQEQFIKHIYFIVVFSVMAVMTRYASAVILFPFIVSTLMHSLKIKHVFKHIPALILIIAILLTPHFLVRYSNYDAFLSHQWLQDWSVSNFFKTDFTSVDGWAYYTFPSIIYAFSNLFHPGYIFIGVVILPLLFIKKSTFMYQKTIAISILLYALFLAGIPYQNNRFLILSFPLVLVCFYPIFIYLSNIEFIKKKIVLYVGLTLVIQSILIYRVVEPTLERNYFEQEITEILKPFQNQKLYSFDVDIALKGRGLKFDYQNLWERRYTNMKAGDLVLFHPTKFQKQWKDKNPILNWNYIQNSYHLKILKECPEGWKLYQIQTK
jgi:hypothetical protein